MPRLFFVASGPSWLLLHIVIICLVLGNSDCILESELAMLAIVVTSFVVSVIYAINIKIYIIRMFGN